MLSRSQRRLSADMLGLRSVRNVADIDHQM